MIMIKNDEMMMNKKYTSSLKDSRIEWTTTVLKGGTPGPKGRPPKSKPSYPKVIPLENQGKTGRKTIGRPPKKQEKQALDTKLQNSIRLYMIQHTGKEKGGPGALRQIADQVGLRQEKAGVLFGNAK